jgi:hypothetical protein
MSIVTGIDVGQQICDVFGLNANHVQEIHIHIVADDKVMVDVKQVLQGEQLHNLLEVFKSFSLVENDMNKEKEVCFKYGDHIQTLHPKTGEKLTIIYTPNVVDEDGYVYLVDWGYVHIDNFIKEKESDTNENEEDCRNNAS